MAKPTDEMKKQAEALGKKKNRRPKEYDPDIHPILAWGYAIDNATDEEIANGLGVTITTLKNWKNQHPEFLAAIKEGKEPIDNKVKRSLFERATGYDYKEKKVIQEIDQDGNKKPARIEIIEKHSPPDVGAQAMWLKNRLRHEWKDKWEIEHSGAINNVMEKLTEEELRLLVKMEKELESGETKDESADISG